MEWLILSLVGVLYFLAAWLSFDEYIREQWWFFPAYASLGTIVGILWCISLRYLGDKQKIFFFGLCWDVLIVLSYYFVPIFFFNVKIDRWGWLGVAFILIGLALIKAKS